jgi:membrane dipeptidase
MLADSRSPANASARALYQRSLVWDNVWSLEPDYGNGFDKLASHAAAGVKVVSITIAGDNHNVSEAFKRVAAARAQVRQRSATLMAIESVDDIDRAMRAGKLGVILHFEGTRCFERDLDTVECFYRLGVRQNLLAFNLGNSAGAGCAEDSDGGLTKFGRRLVVEMNRVGMLVDLSHTGRKTSLDAMGVSTSPCLFSHSNAYAVNPHFRNIHDDQIDACAATGGVIGVSGASDYLGDPGASTAAIFRHLDYLVSRIGPEHVGLGLDEMYEPAKLEPYFRSRTDEWPVAADPNWPGFRYASARQLPELTQLMLNAGYPEDAITGILGGNLLRVCRQVWR